MIAAQTIPDDLQQNKTQLQEAGLVNKLLECPFIMKENDVEER